MTEKFSSPSGDGLVLTRHDYTDEFFGFSSPSGDGLVPKWLYDVHCYPKIFVPECGWGGSFA